MSNAKGVKGEGYKGVRYVEHKTRYYGVKKDRYFSIRYTLNGKLKEEGWGWASEGFTAKGAVDARMEIKQAIKACAEVVTLKERMAEAANSRTEKEAAEVAAQKANVTFGEFYENDYQKYRDEKVLVYERPLFKYWVKPVIGAKTFGQVTELDMVSIKKRAVKAGKAMRTIEYAYTVVRNVFNEAVKHGIYHGNQPITKAIKKSIKYDNRKMRYFTYGETVTLLAALKARSQQVHDMAMVSLWCGARGIEVRKLDWSDVNMKDKVLTLRDTKNSKTRVVPMPDQVVLLFEGFEEGASDEPVFANADGGRLGSISKTYFRVLAELGFNDSIVDRRQRADFHTLRHTFASWLVQKGVPLITVQKLMGHSTIKVTERYSHLAPDNFSQAADVLSAIGKIDAEPVEEKVANINGG